MLTHRSILVADDDLQVRRGVVDLLSPLGPEILEAESGVEVLDILAGRPQFSPIHLLVLDMHMPGCDGLEVLAKIRGRYDLSCICYSGNATRELESKARGAGARVFLHKPVQPELLRAEVLRALSSSH